MASTKELIETYLIENDYEYEINNDESAFSLEFEAENIIADTSIIFGDSYVVVVVKTQLIVEDKKKNDISELLLRINDQIISGSFDFEYDRGLICFRTGLHLTDLELTAGMVQNLLFNSISNVDIHIKAITQLLVSDIRPADVMKIIETTVYTN